MPIFFLMQPLEILLASSSKDEPTNYGVLCKKFPPLACLRLYCSSTPFDAIQSNVFSALLDALFTEWSRYRRRYAARPTEEGLVDDLQDAIERDLIFLEEQLDDLKSTCRSHSSHTLEQMVFEYHRKMNALRFNRNEEVLPRVLVEKPFFSKRDQGSGDALISAIFYGRGAEVRETLRKNPALATYSTERGSVFAEAAWQNDLEILKLVMVYLPSGYDYEAIEGPQKYPPILWAARAGQLENVCYLLAHDQTKHSARSGDIKRVMNEIESLISEFELDPSGVNIKGKPKSDYQEMLKLLESYYDFVTRAELPCLVLPRA